LHSYGEDIIVDPSGNTYVTGQSGAKVHLSKYDNNGSLQWINNLETNSTGLVSGISCNIFLNGNDEVVISGSSTDLDFDPSASVVALVPYSVAHAEQFIASYNTTNGSYLWHYNVGSVQMTGGSAYPSFSPRSRCKIANSSIYLGGSFNTPLHINPGGTPIYTPTSSGLWDSYIAKYNGSVIGLKGDIHEPNYASIFPNPVNDAVFIKTNYDFENIAILNSLGQEVAYYSYSDEVDVSNLPSGIYWLVLKSDDYSTTKKFIKE